MRTPEKSRLHIAKNIVFVFFFKSDLLVETYVEIILFLQLFHGTCINGLSAQKYTEIIIPKIGFMCEE